MHRRKHRDTKDKTTSAHAAPSASRPQTKALSLLDRQRLRHFAAASGVRCATGQVPCRYTGARPLRRCFDFRPDRSEVATDRSTPYFALSSGCIARVAFFTAFGVAALFTARTG
jgi:hypothetical protein